MSSVTAVGTMFSLPHSHIWNKLNFNEKSPPKGSEKPHTPRSLSWRANF